MSLQIQCKWIVTIMILTLDHWFRNGNLSTFICVYCKHHIEVMHDQFNNHNATKNRSVTFGNVTVWWPLFFFFIYSIAYCSSAMICSLYVTNNISTRIYIQYNSFNWPKLTMEMNENEKEWWFEIAITYNQHIIDRVGNTIW